MDSGLSAGHRCGERCPRPTEQASNSSPCYMFAEDWLLCPEHLSSVLITLVASGSGIARTCMGLSQKRGNGNGE